MSHLRVYLLAFCILGVVVAAFAAQDVNCNEEVPPASEGTILSRVEKLWKLQWPFQMKATSLSYGAFLNEMQRMNMLHEEAPAFIPPGLKWCGDGNKAKDNDDLGRFKGTDACCREHDFCKSNMEAGETKLNLKNNGYFTRSHCNCDEKFYKCLKNVDAVLSWNIGKMYFNILGPQCFECACGDDCNGDCKESCTRYRWKNNPSY